LAVSYKRFFPSANLQQTASHEVAFDRSCRREGCPIGDHIGGDRTKCPLDQPIIVDADTNEQVTHELWHDRIGPTIISRFRGSKSFFRSSFGQGITPTSVRTDAMSGMTCTMSRSSASPLSIG
jgi:hypothetical protein